METYNLDAIFEEIENRLKENPKPIEGMNAIYQFDLKGDTEKTYQVHLNDGKATVEHGNQAYADCNIKMNEEHFLDLLLGRLNGISAFLTGKLKVKGSMDLAMKLQNILGSYNR